MPANLRISPTGPYVNWQEEFAGVNLGIISRVGQVQGPASPVNLLASQAAGQLILSIDFSLTTPQYNRIQSGEYTVGYLCVAEFEVQDINTNEGAGSALLSEFMVLPAGGATGRRITKSHRQWEDDETVPAGFLVGVLMGYLAPAMVSGWAVGNNAVQLGLSFPGVTTGTVPEQRSRLTVVELVGNPGYSGP